MSRVRVPFPAPTLQQATPQGKPAAFFLPCGAGPRRLAVAPGSMRIRFSAEGVAETGDAESPACPVERHHIEPDLAFRQVVSRQITIGQRGELRFLGIVDSRMSLPGAGLLAGLHFDKR